jgi:DNA-binding MarR family transcriptional regulator
MYHAHYLSVIDTCDRLTCADTGEHDRRQGVDEDLRDIERELTLIGRHQAMVAGHPANARLDRSAYVLLTRLEIEGPMSVGQLATALGLDTSTVTRQTAAILRAGLVERIPDPDGGIARKLRVTGTGAQRLAADRAWIHEGLARVVGDWPHEDVRRLADALAQFNHSVERLEGRGWPRTTHAHD